MATYEIPSTDGPIKINPLRESVDHLNIYSMSRSELGRALSNFNGCGVDHPTLGYFKSLEGAWMYLSRDAIPERIRTLYGAEAKQYGRHPKVENPLFKQQILSLSAYRLAQHPRILEMLRSTDLPITHYYTFGKGIVDGSKSNMFQLKFYRAIAQGAPLKCALTDAMLT